MRFPWQPKLETRSGSYSDARLLALLRETEGAAGVSDSNTTAAV